MEIRVPVLLRKLFLFVSSLIFIHPQILRAATQISAGSGVTTFHGDLSSEVAEASYGFILRKSSSLVDPAVPAGVRWFTGVEIFSTKTVQSRNRFPYTDHARLSLLGFFVSPGLCQGFNLVEICGAVGIGTLNVNSKNNRQDYGTWNYQIDSKYWLSERFFGQIAAKKIGDVEQTVDGRASHFWLTTLTLSAGFQL